MNKSIYLLPILLIFTILSCTSNDDNMDEEKKQDYTSFVFIQTVNNELSNCVVAYKIENKFIKIAELGTLSSSNKESQEIRVLDNTITEIYFFTDYNNVVRVDHIYQLIPNEKNVFKLTADVKGILVTNKKDSTQYPQ